MRSGGARQVIASARIISTTQAKVNLQNLLSRPAKGQVRVLQDGKVLYDAAVAVPGNGDWKLPVTLPQSADLLRPLPLQINFQPQGETAQTTDVNLELLVSHHAAKPPVIDGDLSDWPQRDALALPSNFIDYKQKNVAGAPWGGPADLSGTLYTAWDEQHFYLAVKVRDNVLHPADALLYAWQGDSLQVYFDAWNNARAEAATGKKGFDGDDQVFDAWPSPQGIQVRRSIAPDAQVAFLKTGPVPAAQSAFKRTADGYIIEMALPANEIIPLSLKAGAAFGFAILINDNDGQWRHRGLTLTPAGTEPYMHPELYPTMVLDEG
jgi:hypothetical protein